MTAPNDSQDEMFGSWIDRDTAERMLAGGVAPDDAPPAYRSVAAVVQALRAAGDAEELSRERIDVAAAVQIMRDPVPSVRDDRRWPMRSKLTRIKAAGLVAAGAVLATSGMAAANVLPDAAQDAVSTVLSQVGIEVPRSTPDVDTSDQPAATGQEISEIATSTEATGLDKGAEISETASGGVSQAGEHGLGAQADVPDAESGAGSETADDASGGASETGTDTADDASGGASESGSGNVPTSPPTP